VGARKPWVLAVVGLFTTFVVILFVLASAAIDIPSEVSLPLIVLAAVLLRSFKNRRERHAALERLG
jgi:hypothetical protein